MASAAGSKRDGKAPFARASRKAAGFLWKIVFRQALAAVAVRRYGAAAHTQQSAHRSPLKTAGFLRKSAAETKNERGDSTKVRRPGRSAVYAQIYQEAFRTPGIWPL